MTGSTKELLIILGPVLFIIYINDLVETVTNGSSIYLYADDAKIYKYCSRSTDCISLQSDVNNLVNWSDKWLMNLNIKKRKIVSYSRELNYATDYYINNVKLDRSDGYHL